MRLDGRLSHSHRAQDVEELRQASHCSLDDAGRPHAQVLWFWTLMRLLSDDLRSQVLQFVTGNERPPLTGFQALEHPFTVQVGRPPRRAPRPRRAAGHAARWCPPAATPPCGPNHLHERTDLEQH